MADFQKVKYIGLNGDVLEMYYNKDMVKFRLGDLIYHKDKTSFYDGTQFVSMTPEEEHLVDKHGEEVKVGDYIAVYFSDTLSPYYGRLEEIENTLGPVNIPSYRWLVIKLKTVNLSEAKFNYYPSTLQIQSIYEIEKITFDDIKKLCIAEKKRMIDATKNNIKSLRKQIQEYRHTLFDVKHLKEFPEM